MDWTSRGIDDAGVWQARRPVSAILAVAGAVVLAVTGVACSHGSGASTSIAVSGAGGNSGSGCPTQGVGGDTLAPPCASPAGASIGGTDGTPNPAAQSPPSSRGIALSAPSGTRTTPSALGISGPITPRPTPPSPGISGPIAPSSPAPPAQVTAISPATGTGAGGDSVTIIGSGFTNATEVYFGAVSAVVTANSYTEITAISPPGTGIVYVTVVTPNGTSTPSPGDQFSYVS